MNRHKYNWWRIKGGVELHLLWRKTEKALKPVKLHFSSLKEVAPKACFFLSSPIKHFYWVKLLTKVSAFKVHAIPRNYSPKKPKIQHRQPPFWSKCSAARPLSVLPNLNLAGSSKCSWLSNMLKWGFSCLVSCVKMPTCSATCCSNREDKDPGKRLSFHNLPFKSKKLAEKGLDKLCRDASARFMTKKHLRMSMFVGTLPKGLLQSHFSTDTKCWVRRQERGD